MLDFILKFFRKKVYILYTYDRYNKDDRGFEYVHKCAHDLEKFMKGYRYELVPPDLHLYFLSKNKGVKILYLYIAYNDFDRCTEFDIERHHLYYSWNYGVFYVGVNDIKNAINYGDLEICVEHWKTLTYKYYEKFFKL